MENFYFDASQIEPQTAFDPIPDGWYSVSITGAEWKATQAGAQALSLTMEVDGNKHPLHANRKLWASLNLNNASDKAREIAQRELSSICHSINKLQLANISDLLGAQLLAKVVAKPAQERDGKRYDARNEIKGYKAAGDAPKPAATTTAAAPAAAAAKPSWKRG
jgi:hypothetical protein